jgi:hypothetical protein
MALESLDQTRGRAGLALERCEECVAIFADQDHPLMFIEKAPRTFIGEVAGGKTGHGHRLLDDTLGRGREAQFEPLGFVLPPG